jgi:hypothetical protein
MHVPIKVNSPNNTSKWQMEFNSVFKGLREGGVITPLSYTLHDVHGKNFAFTCILKRKKCVQVKDGLECRGVGGRHYYDKS